MLWYIGFFFLIVWLIEKFLLHKGGFIHTLLLAAIGCCARQDAGHCRQLCQAAGTVPASRG